MCFEWLWVFITQVYPAEISDKRKGTARQEVVGADFE